MESGYDENKMYQIETMSLKETNENFNDVSVRLNTNRKVHMVLKTKMI